MQFQSPEAQSWKPGGMGQSKDPGTPDLNLKTSSIAFQEDLDKLLNVSEVPSPCLDDGDNKTLLERLLRGLMRP